VEDLYHPHSTSTTVPDTEGLHLEDFLNYGNKATELILDWKNTRSLAKFNKKVN